MNFFVHHASGDEEWITAPSYEAAKEKFSEIVGPLSPKTTNFVYGGFVVLEAHEEKEVAEYLLEIGVIVRYDEKEHDLVFFEDTAPVSPSKSYELRKCLFNTFWGMEEWKIRVTGTNYRPKFPIGELRTLLLRKFPYLWDLPIEHKKIKKTAAKVFEVNFGCDFDEGTMPTKKSLPEGATMTPFHWEGNSATFQIIFADGSVLDCTFSD